MMCPIPHNFEHPIGISQALGHGANTYINDYKKTEAEWHVGIRTYQEPLNKWGQYEGLSNHKLYTQALTWNNIIHQFNYSTCIGLL